MAYPHPFPTLVPPQFTLSQLAGVKAAGVRAGIKASGNPDVALLVAAQPMAIAGIFTQNAFPAAPVWVSREHLQQSGGWARALVINSGNANACTGEQGLADAREMCARVAAAVGCAPHEVLVCSTGVIGNKLPMDKVRAGIDAAMAALSDEREAGQRFLSAVMTTDAFPKEAAAALGEARISGLCKGAGMIEPNMATMLAFVGTDATLSPAQLSAALPRIARQSFNAVHVDTHTSTNDTFFLFATGRAGAAEGWEAAITTVAHRLAWLIARDGEGATKVTTIRVRGARDDAAAHGIAKHVAASALVRTALFGNDPNWGRFVSQAGNSGLLVHPLSLRCALSGIEVFRAGEPTPFDRAEAAARMKREDVALDFTLDDGPGEAVLMTSDLGYRYVEVNAEYTT